MTFDMVLGIVAVAIGLATLAGRLFGWEGLTGKRQPMRDRFGDRTGDAIHLIAYTILPLAFGMLLIYLSTRS